MARVSGAVTRKRKGRVGGEIYKASGNITIVSEAPQTQVRPLSVAQISQSEGLKLWNELYEKVYPVASRGWSAYATKGKSCYSAFMGYHLKNATIYDREEGYATPWFDGIYISRGKIYPTTFNVCQLWVGNQYIAMNWLDDYYPVILYKQGYADIPWVTIYNYSTNQWGCMKIDAIRGDRSWTGSIASTGVSFELEHTVYVYLSFQGRNDNSGSITGSWSDSTRNIPVIYPMNPNI